MAKYQLMPPLAADERAALMESIAKFGVSTPIVVDDKGEIIDGHHRWEIATHLGIECPRKIKYDLTEAQKFELSISLNLDRRQATMTREQRRELIAASLKAQPGLSDRQHAERAGVDHKTVGAVRDELVTGGEIPHHDHRTGKDGVQQPVVKVTERESKSTTVETPSSPAPLHVDPSTGEILESAGALNEALVAWAKDDPGMRKLEWQKSFQSALVSAHGITRFDPEDIAANADEDQLAGLKERAQTYAQWVVRVESLRPRGLRVVGGH